MSIDTKTSEFTQLTPLIQLSDALLGGTRTMRAAAEVYLPRMALEEVDNYNKRLEVSVLYPAYAETVKQMVGRVFFKSIGRQDIAISPDYLEDLDLSGNNLDAFLMRPFQHALSYSRSYVLVTAPDGSQAKTKADEIAQHIRPYAVLIHPSQVLGIKRSKGEITEFRYLSTETVIDGNYKETKSQKVIVHTAGKVAIYVKTDKEYVLSQEYEVTAKGAPLPIVPIAEMILEQDALPLEHLAYLNVKHWQSQSDQDNILKYARVPMLKTIGLDDHSQIQVGGTSTNLPPDGDMAWVEHSGAAIGAGQASLDKLELQMQAAGAKLLTRTKLSMTDSQAKDEAGKEISILRKYANQLEDFTAKLLHFYALFEGKDDGGSIEISGNIDADFDTSASMDRVDQGVRNGYVSPQTAFEELQRRSMVSPKIDWDTEQARLDSQHGQSSNI